ncbi:MAG: heme peroxidase family protein [Vulcanimicrobiaceae bacterium]
MATLVQTPNHRAPVATAPIRPHGVGVRGSTLARTSLLFEGPFGRMFRALPPADYGANDEASRVALMALGAAMVSVRDPADPKDGPDPEESGIPAAYTYFGQFVDHDLTFDPASSLQRQNDPDALVDYRTPRFDLDNVYGRGPDDQPYLYEGDGISFVLGRPLSGAAANPRARDLPRSASDPPRALIGDPRNDENVIVSQFQGLMHRFHNRVARDNPTWSFERVQREVRFHYQWVVLNDFLPTIVDAAVLATVLPPTKNGALAEPALRFYRPKDEAFIPLEFSVAAYRFGHSMVRPGYRLSETMTFSIFGIDPNEALTGFREFPDTWAIDWNLFMDLEKRDPDSHARVQRAYKIDTSIVDPLGNLPPTVAHDPPPSLAQRNLVRGHRMRLPSGQAVARAMGLVPLADEKIVIGKFTGDAADLVGTIASIAGGIFSGNCPLWTYVLAETLEVKLTVATSKGDRSFSTRKLGPVGGRIVAETFVGLLVHDSSSFVSQDPLWKPPLAVNGRFGLRELIAHALTE